VLKELLLAGVVEASVALFGGTSRRELTAGLRDPRVDPCLEHNRLQIESDARLVDLDSRSYETQVRLHLPSLPDNLGFAGRYGDMYQMVRPVSLVRSAGIKQELELAATRANSALLLPHDYRAHRDLRLDGGNSRLPLRFGEVLPSIGHVYQSRMHYLRSARADTRMHFGLFLPGAAYPLTYVALSRCDRPYVVDGLLRSKLRYRMSDCLVVTRMFGLPGIPPNLMSLTLKHVVRALRRVSGARLLITAYNPLLGFTGAAFRASGFAPFAVAPVSYRYTAAGEFTTRRAARPAAIVRDDFMPNVLTVRGIDRETQKEVMSRVCPAHISMNEYTTNTTVKGALPSASCERWQERLREYRRILEKAWSAETMHPSYLTEVDQIGPSSRGQCGVSSVWLARELADVYHAEPTYCYGDLLFPDGSGEPVTHHCWVEVGDHDDPGRVVIDLTSDQAEPSRDGIVCASHRELLSRGMNYVAHSRQGLEDLVRDRVWARFLLLDDAIGTDLAGVL